MNYYHLERLELNLDVLSPVYIGSGESVTKKGYIYDKATGKIAIPDIPRVLSLIAKRNLAKAYNHFLLSEGERDFGDFLKKYEITETDYEPFILYNLDAGEFIAKEKFREIHTFIKGPDRLPYIPGSSLKGALRTALGAALMKTSGVDSEKMGMEHAGAVVKLGLKPLEYQSKVIEKELFRSLKIWNERKRFYLDKAKIETDWLRGISICDSPPIPGEALTLCDKFDLKPDGSFSDINLYRECLRPGTTVKTVMTLDKPLLKRAEINTEMIIKALDSFSALQQERFERYFTPEGKNVYRDPQCNLLLGGGAGYISKSFVYPLFHDRDKAVELTAHIMESKFKPEHRHDWDVSRYKVSPHTLKLARCDGRLWQMGCCRLTTG